MVVKANGYTFSVSDERIKSFKTKDKFIESQLKEFQGSSIDAELIKQVSGDMYDAFQEKPAEIPPKKKGK